MDNYFSSEIMRLEREVVNYKTAGQKSATVMSTVTKTIPLEFTLVDESQSSQTRVVVGHKTLQIISAKDAIIIPTLDWYYGDISGAWQFPFVIASRFIDFDEVILPNGNFGVNLMAFGTNSGENNDADKVGRGETVTISCNFTVQSTADFEIEEI